MQTARWAYHYGENSPGFEPSDIEPAGAGSHDDGSAKCRESTCWSAGLFMKKGFVTGYYGKGEDGYRPLGVDPEGQVYIPMAPDLAPVSRSSDFRMEKC